MKTKFVALAAAALISIFGAAGCADQLRDEAEQRALDEVERQVEEGRTEAEQQVEEQLQEARKQAEEQ